MKKFNSFEEITDGIKSIWRTGVNVHKARDMFSVNSGYATYKELVANNKSIMPSGADHLHTVKLVDGKLVDR
jgi:hypothetical protein